MGWKCCSGRAFAWHTYLTPWVPSPVPPTRIMHIELFGIKQTLVLGIVTLTCHPSTGEAGTRLPGTPGQPGLQSELEGPV